MQSQGRKNWSRALEESNEAAGNFLAISYAHWGGYLNSTRLNTSAPGKECRIGRPQADKSHRGLRGARRWANVPVLFEFVVDNYKPSVTQSEMQCCKVWKLWPRQFLGSSQQISQWISPQNFRIGDSVVNDYAHAIHHCLNSKSNKWKIVTGIFLWIKYCSRGEKWVSYQCRATAI